MLPSHAHTGTLAVSHPDSIVDLLDTVHKHNRVSVDQLAGQFERWRQTRSHPADRIPQPLWDQAVALSTVLP